MQDQPIHAEELVTLTAELRAVDGRIRGITRRLDGLQMPSDWRPNLDDVGALWALREAIVCVEQDCGQARQPLADALVELEEARWQA